MCSFYGCRRCADASDADFKTYPEPRKSAKGMMLAEVKLLMEDKISGDREKGEETPTTKTKYVPGRDRCSRCSSARGERLKGFGARGCDELVPHFFLQPALTPSVCPRFLLTACSKRRMRMSHGSATRTRRWRLRSL